jgi:chitin synthase
MHLIFVYSAVESGLISLFAFYLAPEVRNSQFLIILQSGVFAIYSLMYPLISCNETDCTQGPTEGPNNNLPQMDLEERLQNTTNMVENGDDGSNGKAYCCCGSCIKKYESLTVCCKRCFDAASRTGKIVYTILIIVQVGILALFTWLAVNYEIGLSFVPLIGLSILWCSKLQLQLLTERPAHQSGSRQQEISTNVSSDINGRWRVGVYSGVFRILCTTSLFLLISKLDRPVTWHCLHETFLHTSMNKAFYINIFSTLSSYVLAWASCSILMQGHTFILPLPLSTLGAVFLLFGSCKSASLSKTLANIGFNLECKESTLETALVLSLAFLLVTSQLVFSGMFIMREKPRALAKEERLFIQPFYLSPFAEQFLLLNRKTMDSDESAKMRQRKGRTKVYVCTTMYHESVEEQRHLLESLQNLAEGWHSLHPRRKKLRFYEAHIFFDQGCKGVHLGPYALKLLHLLEEVSRNGDKELAQYLTKHATPYGIQLEVHEELLGGIKLYVHLKDEAKAKRKKRWSQVMYMTYICKKHRYPVTLEVGDVQAQIRPDNVYILTTDGDVQFQYQSVEHLIHSLQRDPRVGAVCGRTHPVGSGPVAWYQIFDYALGHWFQKVSEHVLGSVMCTPGCFSMYRVKAISSVLENYNQDVQYAKEFLKKDMGEDRWLSTILVEKKWHLEYCAAADNKTHCPTQFDEFFNQRRRWIPSTMANIAHFCANGWHCCSTKTVTQTNDSISIPFIFYQAIMLSFSIIAPSTVILVMAFGLLLPYVIGVAVVVILFLTFLAYGIICLIFSQKVQLLFAKMLSVAFAILMGVVVVRIISQTYKSFTDLITSTNTNQSYLTESEFDRLSDIPFLAWYAVGLAAIYTAVALLHPFELPCLLHSFWYLFFLPSGYLLIPVYAICNLHDQTWGTRGDSKVTEESAEQQTWKAALPKLFPRCRCCWPYLFETEGQPVELPDSEIGMPLDPKSLDTDSTIEQEIDTEAASDHDAGTTQSRSEDDVMNMKIGVFLAKHGIKNQLIVNKFREAGYDDASFLVGISTMELEDFGVTLGHLSRIEDAIRNLTVSPQNHIPKNVRDWLASLRLGEYEGIFRDCGYETEDDVTHLQELTELKIRGQLKITKEGHVRKLLLGIKSLHNVFGEDRLMFSSQDIVDGLASEPLPAEQYEMWKELVDGCLSPSVYKYQMPFKTTDDDLKKGLKRLRNVMVLLLLISNGLCIILFLTLLNYAELQVGNYNAVGILLLVVYGAIIIIQFLAVLGHRLATFAYWLVNSPCCHDPRTPGQTHGTGNRMSVPVEVRDVDTSYGTPIVNTVGTGDSEVTDSRNTGEQKATPDTAERTISDRRPSTLSDDTQVDECTPLIAMAEIEDSEVGTSTVVEKKGSIN